jgi:hypothetical protein
MNPTLLATIAHRRSEIASQIEALKLEDADLAVAQRAVTRLLQRIAHAPSAPTLSSGITRPAKRGRAPKFGDRTQRDLVVAALADAEPPWLGADGIIAAVKAADGVALPKRTLSPLLSVMKREGLLTRQGHQVALISRIPPGSLLERSGEAA